MELPKVVFLHFCSPRDRQNQAKMQPQPKLLMKSVLLWLSRGKSEPVPWTAAELKDHGITWNARSGSQIISLLAFWLLIKEEKVTPKHLSTSQIPLSCLQNSLYRSISQFCSLLPHFTALPVTQSYSWALKGPGFTLKNSKSHHTWCPDTQHSKQRNSQQTHPSHQPAGTGENENKKRGFTPAVPIFSPRTAKQRGWNPVQGWDPSKEVPEFDMATCQNKSAAVGQDRSQVISSPTLIFAAPLHFAPQRH